MLKNDADIFLGVDYGQARIGLAFARNGLVSPIKTIDSTNETAAINEIVKVAIANRISKIIMGIPLDYNGKDTPQARRARVFAKKLRIFLKKPMEFVNENESTKDAWSEVKQLGMGKRKSNVDHISAGIILKRYFDTHSTVA